VSVAALAFVIICCISAPVSAQYFGRNKVQYRTFDFQILKTENFDIQPLVLYDSHVDFEQTNVIGGEIGVSTGGVTCLESLGVDVAFILPP
jgi:hypothetical protein